MLKQIDEKELTRRIQAEQALYKDRKNGIDHYAEVDPVSGRPISKYIDGGVETFPVPSAFEVLPVYFEAVALGNTLHPLGLVQVGLDFHGNPQFELYTHRPAQVQKLALDKIAADVTAQYTQEIKDYNEAFIQQQVDAQLRVDLAKEQRERAAAEAERRAQVEKDIRATFQPAEVLEAPVTTRGKKQ